MLLLNLCSTVHFLRLVSSTFVLPLVWWCIITILLCKCCYLDPIHFLPCFWFRLFMFDLTTYYLLSGFFSIDGQVWFSTLEYIYFRFKSACVSSLPSFNAIIFKLLVTLVFCILHIHITCCF